MHLCLWVLAITILGTGICVPLAGETFFELMRETKGKKKYFIHRGKCFQIILYVKEKKNTTEQNHPVTPRNLARNVFIKAQKHQF